MQQPIPSRQPSTAGRSALYVFAGSREPVDIVSWTSVGQPVAEWRDGTVSVVERHRVRLLAQDELA